MPRVKLFDETEVLTKAMNLFWKQGYAATSVQDLVSHLGINRASLYATFGDKGQLFKKCFDYYRKLNMDGLLIFFKSRPDVKAGFSELFNIAIDEAVLDNERKGCFVVNVTTELIPNDEGLLCVLESNKQMIVQLFYDYLSMGKSKGQIKTTQDLMTLSMLLYTLYAGIKVVSKVHPSKKELTESVNLALTLLV